jgi:hypothetical protein
LLQQAKIGFATIFSRQPSLTGEESVRFCFRSLWYSLGCIEANDRESLPMLASLVLTCGADAGHDAKVPPQKLLDVLGRIVFRVVKPHPQFFALYLDGPWRT